MPGGRPGAGGRRAGRIVSGIADQEPAARERLATLLLASCRSRPRILAKKSRFVRSVRRSRRRDPAAAVRRPGLRAASEAASCPPTDATARRGEGAPECSAGSSSCRTRCGRGVPPVRPPTARGRSCRRHAACRTRGRAPRPRGRAPSRRLVSCASGARLRRSNVDPACGDTFGPKRSDTLRKSAWRQVAYGKRKLGAVM